MLRVVMLFGFSVLLGRCVTAMGPSQIEEVTTCDTGDIEVVRKNLLLNGFKVINQGKEDLQTDFKQVSGYDGNKSFISINAVKIDASKIRFKVRERKENLRTVETGSATTTGLHQNQGVTVKQNSLINDVNESDPSYYVEYRERYLALRQQVCGR